MGWEWRKGRRYYYAAGRVGGRVVKRYVGTGRLGEAACESDALDARERAAAKADRDLATRRPRTSRTGKLLAAAEAVLAAWLPAAGFHRPKRGPWRRKRGHLGGVPMDLAVRKPVDGWDTTALWAENGPIPDELVPKGAKPPPAAVAAYLADHPAAVALYGDLCRQAVRRLADAAGGQGQLGSAAVLARADALRRSLAGDSPNPIELLLAERAALGWAAVHQYELVYYGRLADELPPKEHEFHERRIGAAHRRLLASLKALAAVRRLRLPDLLAVVRVRGGPGVSPTPPAVRDALETG